MKKIIEVKIVNNGFHRGTLGWLANCPLRLKIAQTQTGKQAAFLYYSEKDYITLAVRNYDEWITMARVENSVDAPHYLDLPFHFSNAAFAVIEEITETAVNLMNEIWEAKHDVSFEVLSAAQPELKKDVPVEIV